MSAAARAAEPAGGGARTGWLLLACALLLLPGIALYPLFDVDEGAFSEATREMLRSGDWLSTTLNGLPRYDKPILIYWLQAASVRTLGLNEFALRLPSALAGLAWVWAIVRFAAPRLGSRAALLAGWVAASSLGVLVIARAATADALLNALLAAMMFDLWRHFESGDRVALRRAYAWLALGILTKGPIALLIAGAVGAAYCVSTRRWRAAARAATDPWAWCILLLIAAPWYAAQLAIHGRDFVDGFLVRHNLDRFTGTLEGHGGSHWYNRLYYLVLLPGLLLPWSGMLGAVLRDAVRRRSDPLTRYLTLWFGFVFVFFSLSGTQLPHYLLYGMTPLFLLVARQVPPTAGLASLAALPCALLLLLPGVPALLQAWSDRNATVPLPFYAAQAHRALAAATPAYYAVTGACAAAALGLLALRRWEPWRRGVGATALLAIALAYGFTPWLADVLSGPQRRAAALAATLPGAAVQWDFAAPSFSVYRRQETPVRAPAPGELAITRTDRLDPAAPVERLFEEGGVALVRRR